MGRLRAVRRFRVERMGGDFVVLDADAGVVHRLTGPSADAYRSALAGRCPDELEAVTSTAVEHLAALGLVEVTRSTRTRRRVLQAGAALASVGILTLALPSAAQASSLIGDLGLSATVTFANANEARCRVSHLAGPAGGARLEFDHLDGAGVSLRSNIYPAHVDAAAVRTEEEFVLTSSGQQPKFHKGTRIRVRMVDSTNTQVASASSLIP